MRDLCVGEKENCPNLECSSRPGAGLRSAIQDSKFTWGQELGNEPTGVLAHLPGKAAVLGRSRESRMLLLKS